MITMTEIAKLTQVSQATVSRVLNGNLSVAPEIRERVLACAREHDYQLNVLAKGLQGSQTQLLGVLLTDISNGFFADLAKQIEAEAHMRGYSMILFNSDYDVQREQEYLDIVRRYRVDGVLAVPILQEASSWLDNVRKLDVPAVSITQYVEGMDSVYLDHEEASQQVARHLAERGYERFLFIGQSNDIKYLGFHQELSSLRREKQTSSIEYFSDDQLKRDMQLYFQQSAGRTGVFANNDIVALRVLSILRSLDIPVPAQAGVIGFDDTCMSRYLCPSLSSVSQPIEVMAREAVARLLYRIENPRSLPVLNLPLHGTVLIREST